MVPAIQNRFLSSCTTECSVLFSNISFMVAHSPRSMSNFQHFLAMELSLPSIDPPQRMGLPSTMAVECPVSG